MKKWIVLGAFMTSVPLNLLGSEQILEDKGSSGERQITLKEFLKDLKELGEPMQIEDTEQGTVWWDCFSIFSK